MTGEVLLQLDDETLQQEYEIVDANVRAALLAEISKLRASEVTTGPCVFACEPRKK